MQRIRYAGVDYLADDHVAGALLAFAKALADRQRVELVEIRVGHDDGTVGPAWLIVGAGIAIAADPVPADPELFDGQLGDADGVMHLQQLTDRLLRGPNYRPGSGVFSEFDDYDL